MSRKYSEPIEVRQVAAGHLDPDLPVVERPPSGFRWQRRRYEVTAVLDHWVESGSWWRGARQSLAEELPIHEVQFWRVEARAERGGSVGVYDLSHDPLAGSWELTRAWD